MEKWYRTGKELLADIENTVCAEHEIALWNTGQCGYIMKFRDKVIGIDLVLNELTDEEGNSVRYFPYPFEPSELKIDYVFCTHGHIDHLAPETVKGFHEQNHPVKFIVPAGCRKMMEEMGITEEEVCYLQGGMSADLGEISVDAFSAAHPTHVTDPEDDQMALSYGIHFGDIYLVHLGDGYLTEHLLKELLEADPIQIFMPPINGDDLFRKMRDCIGNMEAEEAAKLAVLLKPELTIPTHYNMFHGNTVDPLRFAAELRSLDTRRAWKIPALGEKVIFRKS